ncbi:hypothetical protein GCM10010343_73610 [Streptomyces avidinii]|nr:hypothetical protein GCM10010343_73610 [Streptomyces avidinii]
MLSARSGDADHALAVGGALGEPLYGGGQVRQVVFGGDVDPHAAVRDETERVAGAVGEAFGVGAAEQVAVVGQERRAKWRPSG